MKKVKILLVMCIFVIGTFMGITSLAAELDIVDGSVLTTEKSATDSKELVLQEGNIIPYGTYLSNGTAGINDQGNGVVYISGETYCYRVSDKVYVELYLQRLTNNGWSTIKTQSSIAKNTYVTYAGVSFAVSKGYYYRVKGYHYAKKGSTVESTYTCTNGIYIS